MNQVPAAVATRRVGRTTAGGRAPALTVASVRGASLRSLPLLAPPRLRSLAVVAPLLGGAPGSRSLATLDTLLAEPAAGNAAPHPTRQAHRPPSQREGSKAPAYLAEAADTRAAPPRRGQNSGPDHRRGGTSTSRCVTETAEVATCDRRPGADEALTRLWPTGQSASGAGHRTAAEGQSRRVPAPLPAAPASVAVPATPSAPVDWSSVRRPAPALADAAADRTDARVGNQRGASRTAETGDEAAVRRASLPFRRDGGVHFRGLGAGEARTAPASTEDEPERQPLLREGGRDRSPRASAEEVHLDADPAPQEAAPGALGELLNRWDRPQAPSAQQNQDPRTASQPHHQGRLSDISPVGADQPDLSALVVDAVDEMLRREVEQYGLEGGLP